MRKSERIIRRLTEQGHITAEQAEGAQVLRTYAGREQRSQGAWSWYLVDAQGVELFVGSDYTVTELLAADWWIAGKDGSIYPSSIS